MNFGLELCCQIQMYNNFYSNLLGITQFTFLRQKVKKFLDEKKMKRRENRFFLHFFWINSTHNSLKLEIYFFENFLDV